MQVQDYKSLSVDSYAPSDALESHRCPVENLNEKWGNKNNLIILISSFVLNRSNLNKTNSIIYVQLMRKNILVPCKNYSSSVKRNSLRRVTAPPISESDYDDFGDDEDDTEEAGSGVII